MPQLETITDHYDKEGLSRFYKERRPNPRQPSLSVPQLRLGSIDNVRYSAQHYAIVTSSVGHHGLEEHIRTNLGGSNALLYIVDNHQHAFFAWCEAILEGAIDKGAILVHFDEHADNVSHKYAVETDNLTDVYNFTCSLWEGNFIYPAIYKKLIKVAYWAYPHYYGQNELEKSWSSVESFLIPQPQPLQKIGIDNCLIDQIIAGEFDPRKLIVDIDLDYFTKFNLSNGIVDKEAQSLLRDRRFNSIDELAKHDISRLKQVIQKAGLVTAATSPGYIDAADALKALYLLFNDGSP